MFSSRCCRWPHQSRVKPSLSNLSFLLSVEDLHFLVLALLLFLISLLILGSMTEDTSQRPDSPPPGFTDLSGPAAYKAQQRVLDSEEAEQERSSPDDLADAGPALVKKVLELETQLAETSDQLLRSVADMDNLRKRSIREREDASKYAVANFARELLDVADTFRRALGAIPDDLRTEDRIRPLVEGIEATERSLLKSFEKYGIRRIEPLDEPFDPNFHEVMFETPIPGKPGGVIVQILEPGFVLHDRLLRPARVGVSKADAGLDLRRLDTQV